MKSGLILIIVFFFTSCNGQSIKKEGSEKIKELIMFQKEYSLNGEVCKNLVFIVDNNSFSSSIDTIISNYVKKIKDTIKGDYSQIGFSFYLRSKITNEEHLKNNPRDLDRYSQENDLLWMYTWEKKKNNMTRFKFKNGKIIYPNSEIKVEDIKQ
jgi:hypothetical protein